MRPWIGPGRSQACARKRPIEDRTLAARSWKEPNVMSCVTPVSSTRRAPRHLVGIDQAASGVGDDHDLVGTQQVLADDQGPDDILGHDPTGVADDVGVTGSKPECLLDVKARVHAGYDRQSAEGRCRKRERSKATV